MVPPLRKWLEGIAKADLRIGGVPAVVWKVADVVGRPARRGSRKAAILDYLKKQAFLADAAEDRPVLVFARSGAQDQGGRPTRPARESIAIERGAFRFPWACETPAVAPAFTCFRMQLTGIGKKESPHLNETGAPLVLLLDRGRENVVVLARGKLRDRALAVEMRKLLGETEIAEADRRRAELAPQLAQMKKLLKGMARAQKAMAKLRKKKPSKATARKLEQAGNDLRSLEASFDKLAEELGT